MAEEYRGRVTFFGVSNRDSVEDGKRYVDEFGVPYEVAHAPEVWGLYKVPYQPVTVIIGADGGLIDRFEGQITYEGLKAAIEAAI